MSDLGITKTEVFVTNVCTLTEYKMLIAYIINILGANIHRHYFLGGKD